MKDVLFKVKELGLERFFEDKDLITLDELIDKLYEQDDEIGYLQERYDDAVGIREENTDRYEDCLLGLM
jgi:hypothetical protein